jgi:hypothetical protein
MAKTTAGSAPGSSKIWSVFSLVSALGAAAVAKKGINATWTATTRKKPPENPADPDIELREAVAWAVFSGAVVGLARMLAQRRAASYYHRSTGHLPPGLEKDGE